MNVIINSPYSKNEFLSGDPMIDKNLIDNFNTYQNLESITKNRIFIMLNLIFDSLKKVKMNNTNIHRGFKESLSSNIKQ